MISFVGSFNRTGFADVSFCLEPNRFRVGNEYIIHLEAYAEPLPFLVRVGSTKISFYVRKDFPKIGLGFYVHPVKNTTFAFAVLNDDSLPLTGRKIVFYYKSYGSNEHFKVLGEAITNDDGRAEVSLPKSISKLLLVKAEFIGDSMYMPIATDSVFHSLLQYSQKNNYFSRDTSSRKLGNKLFVKNTIQYNKSHRSVKNHFLSLSVKESFSIKSHEGKKKVPKIRFVSNANENNISKASLVDFLKSLTNENSSASILVDIAEILNNLFDLPYVVYKLGIIFSKLNIALIPTISGNDILLYKVRIYEVSRKVAKTVVEKVTETKTELIKVAKTITKTVKKKVKSIIKLIKWVKEKKFLTYSYWDPLKWKWITVTQIYYVWVPHVSWKEVWHTVTQTITETVYYWIKVTRTVVRTLTRTVYETIKETKKENINVYKIDIVNGIVINLENNHKQRIDKWLLELVGISDSILKKVTGFLIEKVAGSALSLFQRTIEFLVNSFRYFALALADQVIYYFYSRLLLNTIVSHSDNLTIGSNVRFGNTSTSNNTVTTNGKTKKEFPQDVGRIPIEVSLKSIWLLLRTLSIYSETTNGKGPKYILAPGTKGALNLNALRSFVRSLLGIENIGIIHFGNEQLALEVDTRNGDVKFGNFYWIDMDDYRFDALVRFIPLGIFRGASFAFQEKVDSAHIKKYSYAPMINFAFINPKLPLINEEILRAAVGNDEYSKIVKAFETVTTADPNSMEYAQAKEVLQRREYTQSSTDKRPLKYFIPDWLIDCARTSREQPITKLNEITYNDFYNYLKKNGFEVENIISKALENSGLKAKDVNDILHTPITISDDFKDKMSILKEITQKQYFTNKESESFRFVFVSLTSQDLIKIPSSKEDAYKYVDSSLDVIRDLSGNPGDNKIRESVTRNFDPSLYSLIDSYLKYMEPIIKERGSSYAKLLPPIDENYAIKRGLPYVFIAYDPILFEREKRYTLNELISNPLYDFILRGLDYRIHYLSTHANRETSCESTKIRYLIQISILYAYRTAIYYQVDPSDVIIWNYKNERLTLQDFAENIHVLQHISRRGGGLPEGYVRLPQLTFKLNRPEGIKEIEINSAELLREFTGLNVIVKSYTTYDKKQYFIGYVDIPRTESGGVINAKSSPTEIAKIIDIAESLSYPIEKVLEMAKLETGDPITRFSLEFIGHHGVIHPYMKTISLLIDNLISVENNKKKIRTDIEQDIIVVSYLSGLKDEIANAIDMKIKTLSDDELHLRSELLKLKAQIEKPSFKTKVEYWPAKMLWVYRNNNPTPKRIIEGFLKAISTLSCTTVGILSNPLSAIKSAFLVEVKAGALIKLSNAFIISLIGTAPELFISILRDESVKNGFGILLSAAVLVLFSIDVTHLMSKSVDSLTDSLIEKSDKLDSALANLAFILVGIGVFLKAFDAPFYIGNELVFKIGELIEKTFGSDARWLWNTVAGFEIPLTGQTVFETVIELPLSGLAVTSGELIISALYQVIKTIFENIISSFITQYTIDFICTVNLL